MTIGIGDALPSATLLDADGQAFDLSGRPGPLVVYFYPKDDTSGCTREALDFSQLADGFAGVGVAVLGVSRDAPEKHRRFAAKHAITIELATDADGAASEAFGVWGEKRLYGRTYMGLERATFLFDRAGTLHRAWRRVRVAGHAEEVLAAARAL